MIFENRKDAGKNLYKVLKNANIKPNIVIGLPRGGVEVAYEIAKSFNLPLDVIVTRKIPDILDPELAIGAITEEGEVILDERGLNAIETKSDHLNKLAIREKEEIKRRLLLYRKYRKPLDLKNKIVLLVDDGIATGLTMKAAIESVKTKGAKKIIIAVPVAAKTAIKEFEKIVDKVVCLYIPSLFIGISQFYINFNQVEDESVVELLNKNEIELA